MTNETTIVFNSLHIVYFRHTCSNNIKANRSPKTVRCCNYRGCRFSDYYHSHRPPLLSLPKSRGFLHITPKMLPPTNWWKWTRITAVSLKFTKNSIFKLAKHRTKFLQINFFSNTFIFEGCFNFGLSWTCLRLMFHFILTILLHKL